jgi:hypothetical protein
MTPGATQAAGNVGGRAVPRAGRGIVAALLFACAVRVWGAEVCPGGSAEPLPITPSELWALREQLAGLEPRCGRVATC